ncbi:MAG: 3-phosphoglycerate dehydrogenase, partial [Saprospiraceae bacterium]
MLRVLANDGIHPDGRLLLEEAECFIEDTKVPQDQLAKALLDYDVLLVRSATKVRKELIDQVPNLKAIGRGGVGMDNIDVEYARSKGIYVFNTPASSSKAVAELAFAHIFTLMRGLHQSNRSMPSQGQTHFKELKSTFTKGIQLSGK